MWLCPLRPRSDRTWPLYPLDPGRLYVNVGFWSTLALQPGQPVGTFDRLVEHLVAQVDGHKSLYSTSSYDEDEFWRRYGGETCAALKRRYDPDRRLLDLYDKCVRGR